MSRESIRHRLEADHPRRSPLDSYGNCECRETDALLAVADAAADVLGWLRAAYPPASPMDALIEALESLEALP